jgi:hypothetical protein
LLQQLLGLLEHQVLSRSEGDPLNAVSITARSRSRDSAGYRKQWAGAERFRPVIDGRLDGSAGADQLRRTH